MRALVFIGDRGSPELIEVIAHDNALWLVASWIEHPTTKARIPERIVKMDGRALQFQEVAGLEYRYLVSNSVPTSVLDGVSESGYVVATYPAVALLHALSQTLN